MSKKFRTKRLKLPKRLLGVKLPKDARRQVNDLLKLAPRNAAKPLLAMAVGSVAIALAEKLEQPLRELLKGEWPAGAHETKGSGGPVHSKATH